MPWGIALGLLVVLLAIAWVVSQSVP